MQLPFGLSAYSRANGRLPPVRLVNLYHEQVPTSTTGAVLLPRPGLQLEYDLGAPIRGLRRDDGVFSGDLFAVAGNKLFRGEDLVGLIEDDTFSVEWAYTVDGLWVASGGIVYQYDGTTLTPTAFPDSAPVVSICDIDNFLFAVRQDTGTVYFRVPGDTTWNALDFFSAEREPDPAIAVRALADALYVFGTSSIEAFGITGNVDEPAVRIEGLAISRGCKDRDSISKLDNTLFFTGEDNIDYRIDGVPQRISDHGIEERIEASDIVQAFSYALSGHTFRVIRLDSEVLGYDVATGQWHQLDWPVVSGIYDGKRTYVSAGTAIHTLRDRPDDNGETFERIFTAVAATETVGSCDAIEVTLSPGTSPIGSEPAILQMRWSDDQSRTWSDWKEAVTGFGGQYRKRVRFRRLGMIDAPGRVFEFRMTDPVEIRFSGVEMNPAGGGRSRG